MSNQNQIGKEQKILIEGFQKDLMIFIVEETIIIAWLFSKNRRP